jgi:hypothetical protein
MNKIEDDNETNDEVASFKCAANNRLHLQHLERGWECPECWSIMLYTAIMIVIIKVGN